MNIVLFEQEEVVHGCAVLSFRDSRFCHIKRVLKLSAGACFKAGIINGVKGSARISLATEKYLVAVFEKLEYEDCALFPLHLVIGFPRPIQLRRILRDVSSLGISSIHLVGTELGERSYLDSGLAHMEKMHTYLIRGLEQAGGTKLPLITVSESVRTFCSQHTHILGDSTHQKLILDTKNTLTDLGSAALRGDVLWIAIGSERGWTESERLLFSAMGFRAVDMGRRTLRTETAACAACAVVLANAHAWKRKIQIGRAHV